MEVTTIQIEKEVKHELFALKNHLEKITNTSMTYNDLIRYLLKKTKILEERSNLATLKSLRGILPSNKSDQYQKEKLKDLEHEENRWN